MPVLLQLYQTDDATLISGANPIVFTAQVPGLPSAAQTFHLWNHKGNPSGEDAPDVWSRVFSRDAGASTSFFAAGHSVVDRRMIQLRVTGGLNGLTVTPTGWMAAGADAVPGLPEIPADAGLVLDVRLVPPGSSPRVDAEVLLLFESAISQALAVGSSLVAGDGVICRLSDDQESGIVEVGSIVEDSGGPSGDVEIFTWRWIHAGAPYSLWESIPYTVGLTDGAAAALGAGEVYVALLTLGAGAVTLTKGLKATLGSEVDPESPAGELPMARIVVPQAGISDSDISITARLGYYGLAANGLSIGAGRALVADYLTSHRKPELLPSLAVSSINRVWRARDGSTLVSTTATPPDPSALLLHTIETDGGGAHVEEIDRRRFLGGRLVEVVSRIEGALPLAVNDLSDPVAVPGELVYLDPFNPVTVSLDDLGTTPSAGETSFDLETSDQGGAFTTTFTTAALAQYPQVAWDATDPVARNGFPELWQLPPLGRLRWRVNSIPTAAASPTAATLTLRVWVL